MRLKILSLLTTLTVLGHIHVSGQAVTFNYTGSVQTYTVPPCVFTLNVQVAGAQGGGLYGGLGATVNGTIAVTPGQVLQIYVGGQGGTPAAGYNGGGPGHPGGVASGGGGGGSDIRVSPYALANRVVVAGGGGGTGGGDQYASGGGGGNPGIAGGSAYGTGGSGGTTTAGGAGGPYWSGGTCGNPLNNGQPGTLGTGGSGGLDACHVTGPGGGGGGGYYGGGGGGSDDIALTSFLGGGGGGGGSCFIPAGGTATSANRSGNGQIIITPVGGTAAVSITPSAPSICSGSSVTLTASGSSGYTWSPATGLSATTGASVTANPTTTTTYTVTAGSAGCTSTATATVTVTPGPVINVASATKCASDPAVTLSATGGTTYTWSPATGLSATTGSSVTANPAATTTYTISGTTSGCTGTTTATVTINPNPDVTATPATSNICNGQTTSIALSSTVAGATFSWTDAPSNLTGSGSGSGANIAQTLNTIAPPSGSVVYTITPTAAGCTGTPTTATVNVADPVIDSVVVTDASCNGSMDGNITIYASGATQYSIDGGVTYQVSNAFTGVAVGTYSVMVSTGSGCTASSSATVNQPAALVAPVSSTNESCAGACDGIGGTAPSGGTAPYNYNWSVAGAGNVPFVNSLCAGSYSVTVTDNHGCTVTASITINSPTPVVITGTTPVSPSCGGYSDASLSISATGTGPLSYSIDGGSTYQSANTFTGILAGTYNVVVKDVNGCLATTTSVITQPVPVTVTASNDLTICIGQSTTISANGAGGSAPYTYTWDNGLPSASSNSVSPVTTTTYNVGVVDANGCGPATESVTITVNPPLSVVASANQSICPGASANISAIGSGGNGGPYTYNWTNNMGGGVVSGQNQTVSPSANTIYTVTVSDGCGTPSAMDTMKVSILPLPSVVFGADSLRGCAPVAVNFTHTPEPGTNCSWDFGDGSTSSICNPAHTFVNPGCYDVRLTATSASGCVASQTMNSFICVYPIPVADFAFGPQPASIYTPEITFTNLTIGGATYSWDFGGLGTSTSTDPTFSFPTVGGNYPVTLSTVSVNGCTDSTVHYVILEEEFILYVPNAFTPDANGKNDIFLPIFQGEDPSSYEFYIYDRWGELIFQTTTKTMGWDGTHNGIKVKEDVYVWKIRLRKAANQDKKDFFGHVNLLR